MATVAPPRRDPRIASVILRPPDLSVPAQSSPAPPMEVTDGRRTPLVPLKLRPSEFTSLGVSYQSRDGKLEFIIPAQSTAAELSLEDPKDHLFEERALPKFLHPVPVGRVWDGKQSVRQVMVLTEPFHPAIYEYQLQHLAGIPASQAKDRTIVFLRDLTPGQGLSSKLLVHDETLKRLASLRGEKEAHLICYTSSADEGALAEKMGIKLMANDPRLAYWGSKPGSRQVFEEGDIPHPPGIHQVNTEAALAESIAELLQRHPDSQRLVIKLTEGVSGHGNGVLDVSELRQNPPTSPEDWIRRVAELLPRTRLQLENLTWPQFMTQVAELGAIAELHVSGKEITSPSVQAFIHEDGTVEVLSTHEQMLGGPDGQEYVGCIFPADGHYRIELQEFGRRAGEILAAKGVRGRFAVDFIAADGALNALEINVWEGGTTHPYETLKALTGGSLDLDTGLFKTPAGTAKFYVMSDNVKGERYKGLAPPDVIDMVIRSGLHFDAETQTGVALHMLSSLREVGKVGVMCFGDSPEEAQALYEKFVRTLDEEIGRAPPAWKGADAPAAPPPPPGEIPPKPSLIFSSRQILLRPENGIYSDWIRSSAFAPDSTLVASAVNNRRNSTLRVHDLKTGMEKIVLSGPSLPIRSVAFGPSGRVVGGSADGTVYCWSAVDGERLWSSPLKGMVNAVAVSADGRWAAGADTTGGFAVWSSELGEEALRVPGDRNQPGWARAVALSSRGDTLAVGFANGVLQLVDRETGAVKELKGHTRGVHEVSFSEDDRFLAVTDGAGVLFIWDAQTGELVRQKREDGWLIGKATFQPGNPRKVAFSTSDGVIHVYDWAADAEVSIRDLSNLPASLQEEFQVSAPRWYNGGSHLAVVTAPGAVHEWSFAQSDLGWSTSSG
ncbi:MAG TPA: peptide ligase PGM1-related protein, partial [Myxococcaceae bacterium]|nr:peptide ligase PGM1-related protein [Myxococcaceae bacterium]